MLVLAIISVLVGSAVYYLAGSLDITKEQRVKADLQTLTTQLKTYEMLNYQLPSTEQGLNALMEKPQGVPATRWRQLMQKIPLDPWGSPYQYKHPGVKIPGGFDLYSLGPNKVEGTGNIGNWDL